MNFRGRSEAVDKGQLIKTILAAVLLIAGLVLIVMYLTGGEEDTGGRGAIGVAWNAVSQFA